MKPAKLLLILAISAVVIVGGFWAVQRYRRPAPLLRGVSVVFEFRLPSEDVKELEAKLDEINERISRATNDAEKKALGESADRIKADLKLAAEAAESEDSLAREMIRILKERVDPKGHQPLEWRPVGGNRFEIRMPAPSPAARAAKDAYRRAISEIRTRNVDREELRSLEQGRTTIEQLAAGDNKLAILLDSLLKAYKTLDQKRKSGETKIQRYILDWETAESNVLKYNIDTEALRSILSTYVRPAELAKLRNQRKALASLIARQEVYERSIEAFLKHHQDNPDRAAAIKKVIELHKTWADLRQGLGDPSDLQRLITRTGALEFRIAPTLPGDASDSQMSIPASERERYVKILRDTLDKEGPLGLTRRTDRYLWFPIRRGRTSGYASMVTSEYGGRKYVLLSNFKGKTLLQQRYHDRWALTSAFPSSDERGLPAVGFKMNETGAKLLHTLTLHNKGEHMAILLDDKVYSAPVIQSAISESGIITMGTFNMEEVHGLIKILRAGVLPAMIKPEPVSITPFGTPSTDKEKDSAAK